MIPLLVFSPDQLEDRKEGGQKADKRHHKNRLLLLYRDDSYFRVACDVEVCVWIFPFGEKKTICWRQPVTSGTLKEAVGAADRNFRHRIGRVCDADNVYGTCRDRGLVSCCFSACRWGGWRRWSSFLVIEFVGTGRRTGRLPRLNSACPHLFWMLGGEVEVARA